MFSVAFPLLPFFAMFRNLVKMRYDALRLFKMNRPVGKYAMDIGKKNYVSLSMLPCRRL